MSGAEERLPLLTDGGAHTRDKGSAALLPPTKGTSLRFAYATVSRVINRFLAGALVLVASLAISTSCASAKADLPEDWTEPATISSPEWGLVSVDGPRSITISTGGGECVGKPGPRLLKPVVRWAHRYAVINTRVYQPALHFGRREACAGVGLGLTQKLHLAHRIEGRALYDGSRPLPRLRATPEQTGGAEPLNGYETTDPKRAALENLTRRDAVVLLVLGGLLF